MTPLLSKRGILVLDGSLLLAAIVCLFLSKFLLTFQVDCVLAKFDLLCPSCGGTRAVYHLTRGHVYTAMGLNAYYTISAFIACLGVILLHITCFWKNPTLCKISRGVFHPYTFIVWTIGLIAFGIIRNIL